MTAALLGFGSSIMLKATGAKAALAKVPSWVWYLLAGALAIGIAMFLHHGAVKRHDKALVQTTIEARDKLWQARFDAERAQALKITQAATALQAKITANAKEKHDAQVSNNAALAHDIGLRGPGKAAAIGCRPIPYSTLPTAPGGPQQSAPGANAPTAQVPADDGIPGMPIAASGAVRDSSLALVPWSWLTVQGQSFDDLLAEDHAWRDWWPKQQAVYESMRQKIVALSKQAGDKPR